MTGRLAELARRFQDIIDHLTDKPFTWGQGDGTLSDQTDLQAALDEKADIPDEGEFDAEFTPENGSFSSISYTRNNGIYQKIGSYVWVGGYILIDSLSIGDASGELYIELPFTSASSPLFIYSGSVSRYRGFGANGISVQLAPNNNLLRVRKEDLAAEQDVGVDASEIEGITILSFSIKYKTE